MLCYWKFKLRELCQRVRLTFSKIILVYWGKSGLTLKLLVNKIQRTRCLLVMSASTWFVLVYLKWQQNSREVSGISHNVFFQCDFLDDFFIYYIYVYQHMDGRSFKVYIYVANKQQGRTQLCIGHIAAEHQCGLVINITITVKKNYHIHRQ